MVTGYKPDISHLRIFRCAVYVSITPPLRTKMGPQRQLGIYVGYQHPTIVRYLEHLTGDLFTARFVNCRFDKTFFSPLGGDMTVSVPIERRELTWSDPTMSHYDP